MPDKMCFISALRHFVQNSLYVIVDLYQLMSVTEKVPLCQRDKKKKQKRTKLNLKMFHWFKQCIIKYSHFTNYHSKEHWLSFHVVCILMLVSFF